MALFCLNRSVSTRPRLRLLAALFAIATFAIAGPALADDPSETGAPKTESPAPPPKKVAPPRFIPVKPAVAIKTLTGKGLKKLKPTATSIPWVLPDDVKVCEKLADFAKVAEAESAAAKATKAKSHELAGDSDVLAKARARYSELKGYADKPDSIPQKIASHFRSQQEMMQALQKELNEVVETINKLQPKLQSQFVAGMPPSLKTAIIEWMTARNNLLLAFPAAKAAFADLDKRYHDLAEEPDVATALKSLSKKNHLGSPEFEELHKAMTDAEAVANSGEVPFYRDGAVDSVGAILNDTLPIVILIQSNQPTAPSWAPAELLTKAGIKVDASAPEVTLNFSGNGKRAVKCRMVVVPKLRIGKFELQNLKFLAMPDDAKDLGSEISGNDLKAYDQTPDRETWLYKFAVQAQPKTDDDKPDQPKPDESKTPKPTGE